MKEALVYLHLGCLHASCKQPDRPVKGGASTSNAELIKSFLRFISVTGALWTELACHTTEKTSRRTAQALQMQYLALCLDGCASLLLKTKRECCIPPRFCTVYGCLVLQALLNNSPWLEGTINRTYLFKFSCKSCFPYASANGLLLRGATSLLWTQRNNLNCSRAFRV